MPKSADMRYIDRMLIGCWNKQLWCPSYIWIVNIQLNFNFWRILLIFKYFQITFITVVYDYDRSIVWDDPILPGGFQVTRRETDGNVAFKGEVPAFIYHIYDVYMVMPYETMRSIEAAHIQDSHIRHSLASSFSIHYWIRTRIVID